MSGEIKSAHRRDLQYLTFVMGRLNGLSDEDIVEKLKCESIAHLYQRLSDDSYPVCSACGAAPIDKEQHACEAKRKPGPGTGDGTELPAASRASKLFEDTLHGLLASVADLDYRHDSSQDGRIVGTDAIPGPLYLSRLYQSESKVVKNFSEEQWNDICARHKQDPSVEGFWVEGGGLTRAAGADRHPAEPQTTLIGVYALAGGDMERLLEALYPGTPAEETRKAIRKRVDGKKKLDKRDGLKAIAGQIATLVRGQGLAGAPRPGLTPIEHDAACYITMLRDEKKHSDEEILAKLSNHRMADGSMLSIADVQSLGNLRLRYDEN